MSATSPDACPFCTMPPDRIVEENEHAYVVLDVYPVASGHSLVVSRRHVGDVFELSEFEIGAVLRLIQSARADRSQPPPRGIQCRCKRWQSFRPDDTPRSYPRDSPLSGRH